MRTVLAAAATLLVLAACSGGADESIDEDAWRSDVEDVTGAKPDPGEFDKLRELYVDDICQNDENETEMLGAVAADSGDQESIEIARVSLSHACPDQLPAFERFAG